MLHIIYLQLQVQARARKFYAADCSLVLRSRCIARRLICTKPAASSTHRPARYAPGPARSTRPRCTSPPLRRARPGVHPGLQHPPGLCRDDRRHAAASLSPGTRTAPAVNERHGRSARGSEGSSTRGGGRRGNDRGFWRHQRQWMECKTRFSLKI